jgi:hypothetical protein
LKRCDLYVGLFGVCVADAADSDGASVAEPGAVDPGVIDPGMVGAGMIDLGVTHGVSANLASSSLVP